MLQKIILESFSLVLALGIGMCAYRYMNAFCRLLFLQLVVWSLFYILSYVVTRYQVAHNMQKNNQWLMNIHIPVETGLLLMGRAKIIDKKRDRHVLFTIYLFFLLVYISEINMLSFYEYLSYSDVFECIIMTMIYSTALYRILTQNTINSWYSPEIWMISGILIYFACSVPYISLMPYIEKFHRQENSRLFHIIIDTLASFRYLCLAFGFWLVYRNHGFKKIKIHE